MENRVKHLLILGNLEACSWCSTQRNEILLHETVEETAEHDRKVDYTVIRQYKKAAGREIKDCKLVLGNLVLSACLLLRNLADYTSKYQYLGD